jgi:hypothetical protein
MADEGSGYIIVAAFLIVILILAVTLAGYYYHLNAQCAQYPNIWCWTDWVCPYSCAQGFTGPTGTTGVCWQGTTGLYASFLSICEIPAGSTALPAGCTCAWQSVDFNGGLCGPPNVA